MHLFQTYRGAMTADTGQFNDINYLGGGGGGRGGIAADAGQFNDRNYLGWGVCMCGGGMAADAGLFNNNISTMVNGYGCNTSNVYYNSYKL